jgi:hypothetical protein
MGFHAARSVDNRGEKPLEAPAPIRRADGCGKLSTALPFSSSLLDHQDRKKDVS